MSTKPKIVGVNLKRSVESVPLRVPNQDYKQVVQKVEVPVVKEVVNRKMDSRVKAIVEKFEQNQVKECADMQAAKSKDVMVAQSGINIKRNPLKVTSQDQSLKNPAKEQFDHESKAYRNSLVTNANVRQLAAQFESYR